MSWWTRGVNPPEYDGWFESADMRVKPLTHDEIIKAVKKRGSFRWWRLNHDYKWLKKQMKKMGYSPEDARELLP
jgi:hypothetical protein